VLRIRLEPPPTPHPSIHALAHQRFKGDVDQRDGRLGGEDAGAGGLAGAWGGVGVGGGLGAGVRWLVGGVGVVRAVWVVWVVVLWWCGAEDKRERRRSSGDLKKDEATPKPKWLCPGSEGGAGWP